MAEDTIPGVDYEYDPLFREGESKAKRRLERRVRKEKKPSDGGRPLFLTLRILAANLFF